MWEKSGGISALMLFALEQTRPKPRSEIELDVDNIPLGSAQDGYILNLGRATISSDVETLKVSAYSAILQKAVLITKGRSEGIIPGTYPVKATQPGVLAETSMKVQASWCALIKRNLLASPSV